MISNLDQYLKNNDQSIKVLPSFYAILKDTKDALESLPKWERFVHIFWLMGPFILLIERTPADVWLTILSLAFVVRSYVKRESYWLKYFWVRAGFAFWFWCIFTGLLSDHAVYSMSEAFVWFRFPLFAMATAFWFGQDKRLLYAMLTSTAFGLLIICLILTAEYLIVGQQYDRLSWPYGDMVPGNYLAKAGLPAFLVIVALAVSIHGRLSPICGFLIIFSMTISVIAGERINFLIRACSGLLAAVFWKPMIWRLILLLIIVMATVGFILIFDPNIAHRFTKEFIMGITNFEDSGWMHVMHGGYLIGLDHPIFGIGTANFRIESPKLLADVPYTLIQPHPHNYYVQMFCETGLIGLLIGTVFLWSIIWSCLKASKTLRNNVFGAVAWIIPFGLFWPIATSADFFGQWNNIFMWSAVSLALAGTNLLPQKGKNNK